MDSFWAGGSEEGRRRAQTGGEWAGACECRGGLLLPCLPPLWEAGAMEAGAPNVIMKRRAQSSKQSA